tara:strand:- start:2207 stop:2407 length:201 start_codon:yes stop_codon:yes gene_type:complete
MKLILNTIATLLVFVGIVMIAGSAGDCDGKCVEQANTISQMLMYAGIGLTMFITGSAVLITNSREA